MKKVVLSVVAALAFSAAPALAADMPAKAAKVAPVAEPSPWDVAFGGALMNDYVWRGITQSNHKASVAAYFEPRYNVTKDLQLYVGISGESVSFLNRAAAEIDLYGGARWTIGPVVLDGGFWYYYYPGGECFNSGVFCGVAMTNLPTNTNTMVADMSFWEVYFKPTWNVNDQLAIGGNLFYTNSYLHSGAPGTYVSATAKFTASDKMAIGPFGWYVSGEFGRQYLGTTNSFYGLLGTANGPGIDYADYDTWNVGLGLTWKVFTLDLRYSGTDLSKGDCNAFTGDYTASGTTNVTAINPSGLGSNWCGSAFIAKLSADLTLGSLK